MSKLYYKNIQLVLIVIVFSIPKFLFLDQDIPSYMIGGLSQEDEAYYCLGGVNRYLADENRSYEVIAKSTVEVLQLINTPTTYLGLKIFGNNYYGLRVPVAIASIFLNLILVLFANKRGFSRLSIIVLIIFLSTEFYSFLFGRFYNPQIFSMLFIALILSLMQWSDNIGFKKAFYIGFLSSFMVLGIYVYTIYIALAILIWFVYEAFSKKKMNILSGFVFGGIAMLFCWLAYFYVFNIDFKELIANLTAHGGGVGEVSPEASVGVVKKVALTFLQITSTNFFRFNLFLLPLFVLLTSYSLFTFFSNATSRLYIMILFVFLIQNYFVESYPFKKHIIFYPILLIFVIIRGREMLAWIKNNMKLPLSFFLIVMSLFLIYYNDKLNNSPEYWAGFGYGYYENVNQFIRLSGVCIAVVFTFCLFIYNLFSKIESKGRILVLFCFIPSFVLLTQQFFISRTYFSKNALMSMRSEISNKYVVQQFTHSFQFYSNSIPTISFYDRASVAKINIKELYAKVNGYAIIKAFRNDNKTNVWEKYNGEIVKFNGVNFIFVKEYKLRYYDYFLLKYNEKQ